MEWLIPNLFQKYWTRPEQHVSLVALCEHVLLPTKYAVHTYIIIIKTLKHPPGKLNVRQTAYRRLIFSFRAWSIFRFCVIMPHEWLNLYNTHRTCTAWSTDYKRFLPTMSTYRLKKYIIFKIYGLHKIPLYVSLSGRPAYQMENLTSCSQ